MNMELRNIPFSPCDMKDIMRIIMDGGNFGRKNHKATNSLLFKTETLLMIIKNCTNYYSLAPRELRAMVPYMMKVNWKLLWN